METKKQFEGVVSTTGRGFGFFMHPDFEDDLFIPPGSLNTALQGDTVRVETYVKGDKTQARVIEVISRAHTHFVGTLKKENERWLLVPDNTRIYTTITIKNPEHLSEDYKAYAKLSSWTDPDQAPEGVIEKILGPKGDHEVEIQAILLAQHIEADFPPAIKKEAEQIEKVWQERSAAQIEEAISRGDRRDFREHNTFTIDPDDAKDFDDALSVKQLSNGAVEIGIHIADVSHFVTPGTELDEEARERGFSVYLVDRTIPMLPPELSTDICSLNPKTDRMTFSALLTLDSNYAVIDRWFGRGVIHSNRRFTYKEAQDVLDQGSGPFAEELSTINTIARHLRKERFKRGAIDFDQPEIEIDIADDGTPTRIYRKERLETHKLVEECMLLANQEVAEFIYRKHGKKLMDRGFIYRVHDLPNAEKLSDLTELTRALGYDFTVHGETVSARDIGHLFEQIENTPVEYLIKTAMVRAMAKAQYATNNIGHFALGFAHYTHFTSPIRRYSDLLVHRVLEKHLRGEKITDEEAGWYKNVAHTLTEREIDIQRAERDSIKFKQVEYMQARIGEIFDGVVSSVVEWGIYVADLETGSEGLVPIGTLKDDYYLYDRKHHKLVGKRTKKSYQLGDSVRVEVADANLDRKEISYKLV